MNAREKFEELISSLIISHYFPSFLNFENLTTEFVQNKYFK